MANVLIIAAACHPDKGSEPGLGWNWIRQIADRHTVTAVVGEAYGNREAIHKALELDPKLANHVHFIFLDWFSQPKSGLFASIWRTFQFLYYRRYRQWMRQAYQVARELCKTQRFDLVHQITIASYREPGFPWQLPMPFIWGPVGGLGNMPWCCLPSMGLAEGLRHLCRNILNILQMKHHHRFHRAMEHAHAIFAMDSASKLLLQKNHHCPSVVVAAAFCDAQHPGQRVRIRDGGPLRLLFAGLHFSRKGLSFLLRALASLPADSEWTLDVLGHGMMSESWKRLTRRLRLDSRVTFHGYVSNEERDRIVHDSDVLVFPSLLEGWPAMVAESLSQGLPVITTDLHGMRDMVNERCGFLASARNPHILVQGIASAITKLDTDKQLLTKLSRGALERAAELSAARQMPFVYAAYENAIGKVTDREPASSCGIVH
jgi:glycosyltransferase involved in cell wall biosynthesis